MILLIISIIHTSRNNHKSDNLSRVVLIFFIIALSKMQQKEHQTRILKDVVFVLSFLINYWVLSSKFSSLRPSVFSFVKLGGWMTASMYYLLKLCTCMINLKEIKELKQNSYCEIFLLHCILSAC